MELNDKPLSIDLTKPTWDHLDKLWKLCREFGLTKKNSTIPLTGKVGVNGSLRIFHQDWIDCGIGCGPPKPVTTSVTLYSGDEESWGFAPSMKERFWILPIADLKEALEVCKETGKRLAKLKLRECIDTLNGYTSTLGAKRPKCNNLSDYREALFPYIAAEVRHERSKLKAAA